MCLTYGFNVKSVPEIDFKKASKVCDRVRIAIFVKPLAYT